MNNAERVYITGVGAATPFGMGIQALLDGMLAGQSKVARFAPPRDALRPGYGGEVTLGPGALRELPNSRDMRPGTMTRYTFLSTLGLGDAMRDGKVPWDDGDGALRRGAYVASYTNTDRFDKYVRFAHHVSAIDERGTAVIVDSAVPDAIKKFTGFEFLKLMNNMPTAHAGIQARCQGPCNTFLGSPAGALQAMGRALANLRDGLADTMYVGGTGSAAHEHMMMVRATRDLNADPSHEPSTAARPFDKGATGIVPGEAGAFVVLEREKTAAARGAVPQAELLGYGEWFSVPATTRGLPADTEGTVMSAKKALHDAGLRVEDVDVVVCHGESRNDLDALEARGLADLLGTRSPEVPLVSSTAHIGSVEGATGTLGVGLAVAMMRSGKVPGALHREDPLPEYKGPRGAAATERALRTALVSVTTREGLNAAVVIRKVA